MRWSVALPTDAVDAGTDLLGVAAIGEMAAALEAAGADACHVTDHPYPPASWVAAGGHHAMDPLVALTAAAAATAHLMLHTHVPVPAYRHPALVAHGLASLDLASGGRVAAGMAVGYLEDEFVGLGVDHRRRGETLDTALRTIRACWAGEPGPRGNVIGPRPHPGRRLPIWIGGNSTAALRRVVAHGDGWAPFPASERMAAAVGTTAIPDVAALASRVEELGERLHAAGRSPVDVCCTPFSHPHHRPGMDPDALLEEAPELEAAGVTWVALKLPAPSRAAWLEVVEQLGDEVLRPLLREAQS